MKKVKTDYLDKFITKYVRKFGLYRAISGDEFCYYDKIHVITYSMLHNEIDNSFINFINKKYDCDIRPYYLIFSLLHEIGHFKTLPTIPKEEIKAELFIRNHVLDQITDQEEMNEAYTNLKSEVLANEWALNYLEKNYEKCYEFQKKWIRKMQPYYRKMGLNRKSAD